jgi:pimeloyl-ACP methyl ester carboxylesterase
MLRRLRVPVLVVAGQRTQVPLDAARAWAEALPNARFHLVPAAGHEVFGDRPQAFREAAHRFLSGR